MKNILKTKKIAQEIFFFDKLESTQIKARELAEEKDVNKFLTILLHWLGKFAIMAKETGGSFHNLDFCPLFMRLFELGGTNHEESTFPGAGSGSGLRDLCCLRHGNHQLHWL